MAFAGKPWFGGLELALEFAPADAWNAAAPTWVDITAGLRDVRYSYGRTSSIFSQPSAGHMSGTLVDNVRAFDPQYGSSPYTGGGLDPRRQIRLRARFATVEYTLWTGLMNGWKQVRESSNHLTLASFDATDGFQALSQAHTPISGSTVGSGDTIAARIGRLLDYANYPAGLRSLDPNSPVVAALNLAQDHTVLTEIQAIAGADLGLFYMAQDNTATYRGHGWQLANNLTPAAILGDLGSGGELGYEPFETDYDDQQLINKATATTALGVSLSAADAASDTQYGTALKPFGSVGVLNQNVVQNTLEFAVSRFARPHSVAQQVNLLPLNNPGGFWPLLLTAHMGTRFTLNKRANNVGSVASVDTIVEGGGMSFNIRGPLRVSYWLAEAPSSSYWRMGVSTWGVNTVWA